MLTLLFAAALAAEPAAAAPVPAVPPGEGQVRVLSEKEMVEPTEAVRLSLPTEADHDAWVSPGLRLTLGYAWDSWIGKKPAWSITSHGFIIRPQVRLDRHWSLGSTIRLSLMSGEGEGSHWSTTFEPTFHPVPALGITAGLGYGGLGGYRAAVIEEPPASGPPPVVPQQPPDEVASRTITDGRTMSNCDATGIAALLRVEYQAVAGPLFSTGPFAQADVQWSGCDEIIGWYPDPETGRQIIGTQWWRQQGVTLGWLFTWR